MVSTVLWLRWKVGKWAGNANQIIMLSLHFCNNVVQFTTPIGCLYDYYPHGLSVYLLYQIPYVHNQRPYLTSFYCLLIIVLLHTSLQSHSTMHLTQLLYFNKIVGTSHLLSDEEFNAELYPASLHFMARLISLRIYFLKA